MPTLHFKGKSFVQNHHLAVKHHELVPVKSKSLTDKVSLHDNLIVQGDNLKALKALLPTYAGKVKCIYIDPPYNTGNENWVYNDNVNSPMMQEWLGKVVDKDDLTRHDKWLCMMMPRLKLLKELLAEDGAIMVSIDDNEQHRLRELMDEVLGEDNFVAQLVWEKGRKNDAKLFSIGHEYIVIYVKSKALLRQRNTRWREEKPGAREILAEYNNLKKKFKGDTGRIEEGLRAFYDDLPKGHPSKKLRRYSNVDANGVWRDDNLSWPGGGGPEFDVIHPKTKKPCAVPEGGWRYSTLEGIESRIKKGLIVFREDHTEPPIRKTYLLRLADDTEEDVSGDFEPEEDEAVADQVAGTYFYRSALQATNAMVDLLGSKVFENPKDFEILERFIRYVTQGDNEALILDSFAGSGTTAHAVLKLNKEDGGNRRFILVEMEDYADTITAERVRRVIKGVPKSKNFQEGTGGTFSYFKLGAPIEMEQILHGKQLPSYEDLARYVFYTATGEQFDATAIGKGPKRPIIGTSKHYPGGVFLYYEPRMEYLMNTALTLDMARALGPHKEKRRLVFAPMKYLDQDYLDQLRIDYSQLPFEIYRFKE